MSRVMAESKLISNQLLKIYIFLGNANSFLLVSDRVTQVTNYGNQLMEQKNYIITRGFVTIRGKESETLSVLFTCVSCIIW